MLNALDRLKELGWGEPRPLGMVMDAEGLAALDWARLVDLMRGLVVEAGCELAGSQVQPDASVLFGMIEQPGTERARRVLVKLAAWNEWRAGAEQVEKFAAEVRSARDARGIHSWLRLAFLPARGRWREDSGSRCWTRRRCARR